MPCYTCSLSASRIWFWETYPLERLVWLSGDFATKTCQLSFSLYRACLLTRHIPRTDQQGLPDFTTLSSNNPFRKFSAIPAPYNNSLSSPEIAECEPFTVGPERPLSRNPFLDQTDLKNFGGPLPRPGSPNSEMPRSNGNTFIVKNEGYTGNAVDLFVRIYPIGVPREVIHRKIY